jgi:YVTN family beta-propeller protein
MHTQRISTLMGLCAIAMSGQVAAQDHTQHAASPADTAGRPVKITDPASVVLIVNRDSNDIGFMDIATHKMVGSVFLGNNVNPHMAMMSHDGRYVVTGGTRANKAYIIDVPTMTLVKEIPVGFAPEHLAFTPDGRYYYQGNPDDDSISVIDMVSMTEIKRIPGLAMPLNITFTPDGSKAYIGNYGAHWVGVIDVNRHELLKRVEVAPVPGVARLDPERYLADIKGVSNASISNDGRATSTRPTAI